MKVQPNCLAIEARASFAMRIRFLLLLVLVLPGTAIASDDFQLWLVPTLTAPITEDRKWSLYLESQPRLGRDGRDPERLLLRSAALHRLDDHVSLWLGHAWTPTFMDSAYELDFRDEHRIWQQLLVTHSLFDFSWTHRLRQEQRFIEDANGCSNRSRYLVRADKGFDDEKSFGLTGYTELFVTYNSIDRGPVAGYDRTRYFFGPWLKHGPARYELGYLREDARRFTADEGRTIHSLALSIFVNY